MGGWCSTPSHSRTTRARRRSCCAESRCASCPVRLALIANGTSESIAPIRATAALGLPAQRATPQRRAASRRGAAVGADVKRKAQNQRTRRRPATRTCGGADCVGLCCRRDARAYRPQRRWEEHARAAARAVPRPIERRGRARRRRLPHAQHALAPRAARVRIRTLTATISTLTAIISTLTANINTRTATISTLTATISTLISPGGTFARLPTVTQPSEMDAAALISSAAWSNLPITTCSTFENLKSVHAATSRSAHA